MDSSKQIIDEIVISCARDLFAVYQVQLESSEQAPEPSEYVAVIGFSGESIRGALGIAIDPRLLALGVSKTGGNVDRRGAIEDFLGETANQLLGRIKNRMLAYGVCLHLALPMVLRGVELRLVSSSEAEVWTYEMGSDAGRMSVWIDARLDDGLVLELRDDPELQGAPEGEMMLF